MTRSMVGLWCIACLSSCAADEPAADSSTPVGSAEPAGARPGLCERAGDDAVRDAFCGASPAVVRDLRELMEVVQLEFRPVYDPDNPPAQEQVLEDSWKDYARAVLLSHSTALSGHLVSPINPRAILMNDTLFLAFSRGVQQVELAALDRADSQLNFYLVRFEQACNASKRGCSFGDLYTPSIESDWKRVTLQDDEDLKNTTSDCRQCHQRALSQPVPLMRELEGPWTHFFAPDQNSGPLPFAEPTGSELLQDYLLAKSDEPFAGLSFEVLRSTVGLTLQNQVRMVEQPLLFDAYKIMNERWPYRDGGFPEQALRSATWDAAYEAFKRGEQLALPYYEPRATDASKQAQLTAAYQSYLGGELPAEELPDLADIFSDDPVRRAELGLQVEPDATPAEALVQACGACHNDVLDQDISRARFSIALTRLDRSERKRAIERLKLPRSSPLAMPPADARQLDAETLARLTEYLRADERPSEDDTFLDRAAQLGMAGPQP